MSEQIQQPMPCPHCGSVDTFRDSAGRRVCQDCGELVDPVPHVEDENQPDMLRMVG